HAGAKVVYLGDTLQLQGVEAGKPFELAQKDGIATAYMTDINRQKTDVMKEAVDIITGRNQLDAGTRLTDIELKRNGQSFQYLSQQGRVHETDEVVTSTVDKILAMSPEERARNITITPLNRDRVAINEGVRVGLQARGELSKNESTHEILVSKGFTRAQIKEAQYYEPVSYTHLR
ncbi:AAA family ATPase, partial [Pseudomonas aeruginosa]|nr:AAA family ATPase [Pseudomonas aeruginosa]